jgi:hypothetical protein
MKTENTTQIQAENYRKREKKRKLKLILLLNLPPVVGIDDLGSYTLAHSSLDIPSNELIRRYYVKTSKLIGNICITFTKLSHVGLDSSMFGIFLAAYPPIMAMLYCGWGCCV